VEDWMTTREAAKRLGVNDSRIRQFIKDGRLKAKKMGHINVIHEPDLARLVRDLKKENRPGPKARVARNLLEGEGDA
jgi:excisionase family DNA binding protein